MNTIKTTTGTSNVNLTRTLKVTHINHGFDAAEMERQNTQQQRMLLFGATTADLVNFANNEPAVNVALLNSAAPQYNALTQPAGATMQVINELAKVVLMQTKA